MVTIIPKPPKKIPPWQNLLLYFSLALLVAVIIVYFIFNYFEGRSLAVLQDLETGILEVATPEDKKIEAEVSASQEKIKDFALLFAAHQKPSQFFEFLEGIIHPQIFVSGLELNPVLAQAKITGVAENFQTLAQQIYILEEQDLIKEIKLSNLSVGEGGETEFSLGFSLSPEIFQWQE